MAKLALLLGMLLLTSACGGSGNGPEDGSGAPVEENGDSDLGAADTDTPPDDDPPPSGLTEAERAAAASATANSTTNACAPIHPFYWEIGDANDVKVSGSVGTAYERGTVMGIASASKWLYAAYVAQRRDGTLTDQDIEFLGFKSGYVSFGICPGAGSVDDCLAFGTNGDYTEAERGVFHYGGGHMEKHASLNGLGAMKNADLAAELRSYLGADTTLTFTNPQPAGGVSFNAAGYAVFLRKLIKGELAMAPLLGTHAVCTNTTTCAQSSGTPVPASESWSYSLGHWVEDDPVLGDNAVSSPGAFGFYPWIDATRTLYGILARKEGAGSGFDSVDCGRLVRKAYVTGVAQ